MQERGVHSMINVVYVAQDTPAELLALGLIMLFLGKWWKAARARRSVSEKNREALAEKVPSLVLEASRLKNHANRNLASPRYSPAAVNPRLEPDVQGG